MKKETKTVKKEKMTLEKVGELIEKLAMFTVNGFEKIEEKIEQVKSELKEEMNNRFEDVEIRLTNLNLEQKETNRHLDTMERHQRGMMESLDETVHRNEFTRLEKRVEVLES